MQNPDMGLIDTAESGFHTDVFEPIQFSGIWHRQTAEAKEDLPFEVYDTNRKSAEEDPDTVSRLIQEDVDANFRSGDRSSQKALAKGGGSGPPQRCQAGPARPAPLLRQLDTECQIGKSLANRAWRTSSQTSDGVGLTKDVCKAQKRLRIREDEWRLLLFQRRGELYHFTVCHCGARFSACMVELDGRQCSHAPATNSFSSHFLQHGGWPQAYDVLFRLEATTAPLVSVCTCYFLHLLGCPISWHKIALGRQVRWIGLDMDQLDQTRGTEPWKSTGE